MNSIATRLRRMQRWLVHYASNWVLRRSMNGDTANSSVEREIEDENRLAQQSADLREIA